MEWEKISANDISDKGLMSKIYKQRIQVSIRKTTQLNKKRQRCGKKRDYCTPLTELQNATAIGYAGSSKNQKQLTYDLAIPLLGIYSKKTKTVI